MKRLTKKSKCKCGKKSTIMVYEKDTMEVKFVCEKCQKEIENKERAEYIVICENCGCYQGVN